MWLGFGLARPLMCLPSINRLACRRLSAYSPRGPWYTLYDRPVCVVRWMTIQPGRSGSTTGGELVWAAASMAVTSTPPSPGEHRLAVAPGGAADGSMAVRALNWLRCSTRGELVAAPSGAADSSILSRASRREQELARRAELNTGRVGRVCVGRPFVWVW